jgi:hypothetical protein
MLRARTLTQLQLASEPHTAERLSECRGDLGGRSGFGMSLARGASLRDAGWPRGTFGSRARASDARLEASAGLCSLRLLEVPPWPRSQAYSPIT